jgi:hypothetical protein
MRPHPVFFRVGDYLGHARLGYTHIHPYGRLVHGGVGVEPFDPFAYGAIYFHASHVFVATAIIGQQ